MSSGDAHSLVVSVPGAGDQTFSFSGAPFERKHFDVEVNLASADAPAASASASHHPVRGGAPVAQSGKLNVGATGGWCNVTVDGVARGATPVAGVDLSAGSHKVTCAPADGKAQTAMVVVPADGTAALPIHPRAVTLVRR